MIRAFTPGQFQAAADEVVTGKFQDTILAHKPQIPDYSPLSDIHSTSMNLFIDEETAQFLEDVDVRVDGLSEDFQGIESVSATPFMDEVATDATRIKQEVAHLKGKLSVLKEQMALKFEEYIDPKTASEEVFSEMLARTPKMPNELVQSYLAIRERLNKLEGQLGKVETVIFTETASRIRLPRAVANTRPTLALAV